MEHTRLQLALTPMPGISKLSICVPSYKGATRLPKLMASLAENGIVNGRALYGAGPLDAEVLVCDDGSPDNTPDESSLEGVRFFKHTVNLGCVAAYADLVAAATGEVVLLMDDDALMPAGFMPALMAIMALPNIGALSWKSLGARPGQALAARHGLLEPATQLAGYCMAFRRRVFDAVGGFDRRFRTYCGDSDLALRMTLAGHPSYRVWWPLVPHEEHASMTDGERSAVASQDIAAFLDKWGATGEEMERRALAQLRGAAT